MPKRTELAVAIRAWRDRVRPEEVGLPAGGRRRASGLRREELAALAGMSVDYLVRLEQGRAAHPSPPVLAALARALRLNAGERDLLYVAAGVAPSSPGVVPRHVSPGLQRILDRLADTPVGVFTAAWDLVLANPLWQALFGLPDDLVGREANIVWRFFTAEQIAVVRTDQEYAAFAATMVADLHAAAARYPDDRDLAGLIAELRAGNEWFAELWADYGVAHHISDRKTINSPAVGAVTVDCDVLAAPDSDLRIVVYTARPGTDDAGKLDLLRVTGNQL
ncbi:MAG TPA: helix-turn-helix transcriptional regulator [Mycobacteriales bacterium]|nr:helix-turn-helix transcriptional regulator [Mycobacteriales bacterium]